MMRVAKYLLLASVCALVLAVCLGRTGAENEDSGWTVVISAEFGPEPHQYTPCKSGHAWGYCVAPSGIYILDPGQGGKVNSYSLDGVYRRTIPFQGSGVEAIGATNDHLLILWEPIALPSVSPGEDLHEVFRHRHYRVSAYRFGTEEWETWEVADDPRLGWAESTVRGERRVVRSSQSIWMLTDYQENTAYLYDRHSRYCFPIVVAGETQPPELQSARARRGWRLRNQPERLMERGRAICRLDSSGEEILEELPHPQRYLSSFSLDGKMVLHDGSSLEARTSWVVDLDGNELTQWKRPRLPLQETIGPRYQISPDGESLFELRVIQGQRVELVRRDLR